MEYCWHIWRRVEEGEEEEEEEEANERALHSWVPDEGNTTRYSMSCSRTRDTNRSFSDPWSTTITIVHDILYYIIFSTRYHYRTGERSTVLPGGPASRTSWALVPSESDGRLAVLPVRYPMGSLARNAFPFSTIRFAPSQRWARCCLFRPTCPIFHDLRT